MQNKPTFKFPIEYSPFKLNENFPVSDLGEQYYTLTEKQISSLHIHDCFEIGYCYNGDGIFIVDDKIMQFSEGDACIIFKNQFHKAQSSNDSQWDFVYINLEKLLINISPSNLSEISNILNSGFDFINILKSNDNSELITLIKNIIDEIRFKNFGYESIVRGLTLALIYKMGRLINIDNSHINKDLSDNIIRVLPAIEYISQNYMNDIYIKNLADICNMSLTNFRRYFSNSLNVSPLDYITKIRIQTASILLSSTQSSILDISQRVGYSSLSSFNRHFKSIQGVCPKDWRKKQS